ncbi:MAG: hypothetical protein [Arizlama microvirus]|nr:MAG: hypothetical protein [Arizlama microvirus]
MTESQKVLLHRALILFLSFLGSLIGVLTGKGS